MSTLAQGSSNFRYRGIVTAKVVDVQNRVLHCHHSHNGGTVQFFTDLTRVLAGGLTVREIQPNYLALYTLTDLTNTDTSITWEKLCEGKLAAASTLLPIDSLSFVQEDDGPVTRVQIKIPFTYITDTQIYIFALFPVAATDVTNPSRAIAYYKLEEGGMWKAIDIDKTARQNSLAIEWDLTFVDEGSVY